MSNCSFNADNVYEFLKLLVETGGIHYVDKDHVIRYVSDQSPVGVKSGSGNKAPVKAVALYKENMELDSTKTLLNPFSEYVGYHPERDWFYNYMTGLPGYLIKFTIASIAETVTNSEKDLDIKTAKKLADFISRIDAKFINEIKKVRACDICHIMYSKDKHVAQLISALWEPEFEEGAKSKLRKSSLMLIRDMVSTMLDVELPEELKYTSTLIGCPEFDATIHLVADIVKRIAPIVEGVLPTKLNAEVLEEHLQHIEAYHKAIQWLTTSTASPVKEAQTGTTSVAEITNPPWQSPVSGAGTPVVATPVIPNPTPVAASAPVNIPAAPVPVTPEANTLTPVSSIANARPVIPTFTVPQPMTMAPAAPTMGMPGMMPMGGCGFGGYPAMPTMPMGMGMPVPTMAPGPNVMGQVRAGFAGPNAMANQMVTGLPGGW